MYITDGNERIETLIRVCPALDQARELEGIAGAETWTTDNGAQMSRWPNGRGAIYFGGDSLWGEWTHDQRLVLDEPETEHFDESGRSVDWEMPAPPQ